MSKSYDSIDQQQIEQFILFCQDYCNLIESAEEYDFENIVNFLLVALPMLYFYGTIINLIDDADIEYAERTVNEETYTITYNRLNDIFSKYFDFQITDDDYLWMNDISIPEFLSDIYQDLKDVVVLYNKNKLETQKAAIYLAKYWFIDRWGKESLKVLLALHSYNYRYEEGTDNNFYNTDKNFYNNDDIYNL
ncbi:MAG TPA: DUF5063 domain-containing protein [Bacteroidales bacterium]|jgi:hypothetical protein|nr:DUF5063 domain-containing protein [Bacteroidales bacterium]OQC43331.1 MAG: hypothetical protein BWX61_01251 [Bacteroidetes bacterium ADurb.Bin035]MBP8946624.1 DUF5063 domain-containing protein [Bacteroidales bacterium]HCM30017.1 hypothetical protein [Bacteroidales bacterium]HNQ20399.1 DUF5063 domain-containing protein [Bacteroidales bacterium]